MKTAWTRHKLGLITVAAIIGVLMAGFVQIGLLAPSASLSGTSESTVASLDNLFPRATAAVPITPLRASLAPEAGGDSRLDNYQLERDSCCP